MVCSSEVHVSLEGPALLSTRDSAARPPGSATAHARTGVRERVRVHVSRGEPRALTLRDRRARGTYIYIYIYICIYHCVYIYIYICFTYILIIVWYSHCRQLSRCWQKSCRAELRGRSAVRAVHGGYGRCSEVLRIWKHGPSPWEL